MAPSAAVSDVDASELDMTPSELAGSFHAISTKANRLKRHVRDLKDLYVSYLYYRLVFLFSLVYKMNIPCERNSLDPTANFDVSMIPLGDRTVLLMY